MKTFTLLLAAAALFTSLIFCKDEGSMKFTELKSEKSSLIAFRIILRAGSVNDPKGKEGLNALTARLIADGGTGSLT